MAITNRAKDVSEQRDSFVACYGAIPTSATLHVAAIPYNSTLEGIKVYAAGLSGSPAYDFKVWRFIAGAGVTSISGGSTQLIPLTMGTSGVASVVLAAAGSTLLNLLSGDVITMTSSGANTAVTNMSVAVVIKAVQDIKSSFGI